MKRPDLNTLACVNPAYHQFRLTSQGNLTLRKVWGQDGIRFLRCGLCGKECAERRSTALFNTKVTEAKLRLLLII